ncbi:unnamed protein product [Brachionus calyciflorus]|uniref:Uncharacterized protein n=1 Tax=Brachionus calyciflorus TaxID=104777 RepID=A0A813QMJ8_9BILA|nr:unnamed protein product [Brachionus calyciflorus]
MLTNNLSELSKFYNGNSSSLKPIRTSSSNIETSPNLNSMNSFSNKLSYIDPKFNQTNSNNNNNSNNDQVQIPKNLNDRKLDSSTPKKLIDAHHNINNNNNTKVPNNYTNSHQNHKKIIDTLNDKNMCNYIFQQHLSLKSIPSFQRLEYNHENKAEKNKIEGKTKDSFYYRRTPSPNRSLNLAKKSLDSIKQEKHSITPPLTMNKMPPPIHSNHSSMPSPPIQNGPKQLSKLKRFLTTLQQFAVDISPEIGERVRHLVLNLVNSAISIEEFHSKLQEATNFPLRPFVIPFLKDNLPLLQYELLSFSRGSKLNPTDFSSVDNFLLNDNSFVNNPSPNQHQSNFQSDQSNNKLKRKSPENEYTNPSPNKKTAQTLPLLYISTPNGQPNPSIQHSNQSGSTRARPSPPHQPINIPSIPIHPPPGVPYPIPIPNGSTPKQSFPNTQLLSNHITNFLNSHAPNSTSPNNYFPLHNSHFSQRDFQQALNGSRNSPLNTTTQNINHFANLNAHLSPVNSSQASLLMQHQMNGKNFMKQDEIGFREPKNKEKNFNNYMKEFEQDLNDVLDLESIDTEFKSIDSMLNSIFEMVDRTQKILDTIKMKANKLKSQREIYENELKRTSEYRNDTSHVDESKNTNTNIKSYNEQKPCDYLPKDKEKYDSILKESKKQDENSTDNCWNCGRRAIDTCPRCQKAKYCSKFCLNKNWETVHYKQCGIDFVEIELPNRESENIKEEMSNEEESFSESEKLNENSVNLSRSENDDAPTNSEKSFSKTKDMIEENTTLDGNKK